MRDKLSPHFNRDEFACKCGCGRDTVDVRLLQLCEAVRAFVQNPVVVTSGFRCEEYNDRVGGSKESQHKEGKAADLLVDNPKEVFAYLDRRYPNRYGFGLYEDFIHVDCRGRKARW